MKLPIYNLEGKILRQLTISNVSADTKKGAATLSQSVRVYRSNQRSAGAKTKNRSEITGSTKKIWAQKGTGRARHGSRKAPQFVGGGVVHGPRQRNYKLRITQKQKNKALTYIIDNFISKNKLIVVDKLSQIKPKTKAALMLVDSLSASNPSLKNSKKIGVVTRLSQPNVKRAFSNLKYVSIANLNSISNYYLANLDCLILTPQAWSRIKN